MTNIVLHCGFKTIKYNCRDAVYNKGLALCTAGHVFNVSEKQLSNTDSIITAKVIRQTSINLPAYDVEIEVRCQEAKLAKCCCIAGISGICKHISAVVCYINKESCNSSTSNSQSWGKPSTKKAAMEKYCKGKRIDELFEYMPLEKRSKKMCDPYNIKYEDVKNIPCTLAIMLYVERAGFEFNMSRLIIIELIENVVKISEDSYCFDAITACVEKQYIINEDSIITLNPELFAIYQEHVYVIGEQVINNCVETVQQAQSKKWRNLRRFRISASRAHSVVTRQSNFQKLTEKFLEEKPFTGRALVNTQYGTKNESDARTEYEMTFNVRTVCTGVIIHKYYPWLCASPDGLVYENEQIVKVLEIKCPISCKSKKIISDDGNINVPYLVVEENVILLRRKHQYYTQCQMLMFCTGLQECDFYVYSEQQSVCVKVFRDDNFISDVILKLREFYFKYLLPGIYNNLHK